MNENEVYSYPLHADVPPGFKVNGKVLVLSDPPLPPGTPGVQLSSWQYPKLAEALNVLRMDNGGPSWPPQQETTVPFYWETWLPCMEAAVAALSITQPAPEDEEAVAAAEAGELHGLSTEFYCFCLGEYTACTAIARRSYALTAASNFLSDFFEGWEYSPDMQNATGDFVPSHCLPGEEDGLATEQQQAAYAARTDAEHSASKAPRP